MGAPPNPDEMLRMMENPMFLSQMTEAMNNPAVIQMMQDSPMIRNNPIAREMLQNPEFRRMLLDPNVIRTQLQLQRAMGNQNNAFPAPGATNTTPAGQPSSGSGDTGASTESNTTGTASAPANPFAFPGNQDAAGAANPFAALLAQGNPFLGTTPTTSPPHTASAGQGTPSQGTPSMPQGQNANQPNPFATMMQQLMDAGMNRPLGTDANQGGAAVNPFAGLFNPYGMQAQQPPQPPDNRPPEERYAEQLRQLNDMGFYDFERNVQALRRSGGSLQGAIDNLLNNP